VNSKVTPEKGGEALCTIFGNKNHHERRKGGIAAARTAKKMNTTEGRREGGFGRTTS